MLLDPEIRLSHKRWSPSSERANKAEMRGEQAVAQRRLGDEFLVDIVEAQALRQLLADLLAARADFVREAHDRHGRHSFLYLARRIAGAMARRLPLTSSRT